MFPTTSLAAIFAFSFLAGLGAVISPGPVSTAIVSQAPRRGWSVGPWVAAGHALLELGLVLLITRGLESGLARPSVRVAISFLGALVLVWMGILLIWNTWQGKMRLPRRDDQQQALSTGQMIALGATATATNPFWYAWWVTVAAGYLAQARALGQLAVLAFFLGHIAADLAWDTALSTVIGSGRRWMTDRLYRFMLLACGAFFLYLSWVFLNQGIRLLG